MREEDIERSMKGGDEKFTMEQRATMENIIQVYQKSGLARQK
jgi:hypothetical protein